MARHSNSCIEIIICTLLKTKEHLNRTSIPMNPISEFHDVNRQWWTEKHTMSPRCWTGDSGLKCGQDTQCQSAALSFKNRWHTPTWWGQALSGPRRNPSPTAPACGLTAGVRLSSVHPKSWFLWRACECVCAAHRGYASPDWAMLEDDTGTFPQALTSSHVLSVTLHGFLKAVIYWLFRKWQAAFSLKLDKDLIQRYKCCFWLWKEFLYFCCSLFEKKKNNNL